MSDLRGQLENVQRQVHAGPGSLQGVYARHRRRQRARRLAAGVGSTALTIGAVVVLGLALMSRFAESPAAPGSPDIDASNVAGLMTAWAVHIEGAGSTSPGTADGVVYVATDDGRLYALDGQTGAQRWVGQTQPGVPTNPVIAEGKALVHVGGTLYAFDIGCPSDGARCEPSWTAATGGGYQASPVVDDGVAYVVSSPGGLAAFPLECGTGACRPLWIAPDPESHRANAPVVSDGLAWDSSSHALSAFAAPCAGGGADCATPLVDDLRPNGADLSSGPAAAGETIYVGAADGTLYAVGTACASGGPCEPELVGQAGGGIIGTPAIVDDRVIVGSNDGRVYAFPLTCNSSDSPCSPLWIAETGGPIVANPVVANGVVYVTSTDGNMYAFESSCGSAGTTCAALLTVPIGGDPVAPANWSNRVLYVASPDGTVSAYTVGGAPI